MTATPLLSLRLPRSCLLLFGVLALAVNEKADAAPLNPMNCLNSPFPVDDNGNVYLPFYNSSRRFQWNGNDPISNLYTNNTDFRWQMWFSGNVSAAGFTFVQGTPANLIYSPGHPITNGIPGFETEQVNSIAYDWLNIQNITGGSAATMGGNLDVNHTVAYVGPQVYFNTSYPNETFFNATWHTDYKTGAQGWTTAAAKVWCGVSNRAAAVGAPANRLSNNSERDGVLLGTGDIVYFSSVLPADAPLFIHLRQDGNAPSGVTHANYDLYASFSTTTTTPNPTQYTWRSIRGVAGSAMLEDTILLLPDGTAHNVSIGVHAQSEDPTHPGGFRLFDNIVTEQFSWRVGTSFNYRAPVDYTFVIGGQLIQSSGAIYSATDGTAYVKNFDVWNNDITCGGLGCAVVIDPASNVRSQCAGTVCNGIPSGSGTVLWRDWDSALGPLTFAHEVGHCLYGFTDEYTEDDAGNGTGYVCGHTLMSGPTYVNNATDYCTGSSHACTTGNSATAGNHNLDCTNSWANRKPQHSNGNWPEAVACRSSQFRYYTPLGNKTTPNPEAWYAFDPTYTALGSDIWTNWNYVTITYKN